MKLPIFVIGLIWGLTLVGCENQAAGQINAKDALIKKLLSSDEAKSSLINGKIVVLQTKYCETANCEAYFQDYVDQIQVYSKEDLFMRGISNYLVIEDIDERGGKIMAAKRIKGHYERFEIKL